MTKNQVKEILQMAVNFSAITQTLFDDLRKTHNKDIGDIIEGITIGRLTDVNNIMSELEKRGCLGAIEDDGDDKPIIVPEIKLIGSGYTEASLPVNGGELIVGVSNLDQDAGQAYIDYKYNDTVIDLALAEVKTRELAEAASLPTDNKDIDLYLYSNPHKEDYQEHVRVRYDDIADALADEGREEKSI